MTRLASYGKNRKVPKDVKAQILQRYKDDPLATPSGLSREYGVSRNTIHRWLKDVRKFPSQGITPLRVSIPEVVKSSPLTPCPGCGIPLDPESPEAVLMAHFGTCPGKRVSPAPERPQIAPRGHTGLRWWECQECGGQFQYLPRGGTCHGCDAKING